ncbi:MAG TPA: hypothetical protein PKH79_12705 [Prolixibacteraceae bacterium]|nr:hypothetical protein [Prolixibacteraceae bacterium]
MGKVIRLTVIGIILFLAIFIYFRYFFVFGEGVKAGDLNYIVRKGYVFKTWEGKVIQTGIKTYTPGAIQSNEFEFSVASDSVAKVLELNSGKFVELRYKEYLHSLPWRGNSKYVVSEIVRVSDNITP